VERIANRIISSATVSVPTTAGGTNLLTSAQQATAGLCEVHIRSDVDIAIVDGGSDGTYANSPIRLTAGVWYEKKHLGGPLKAISSAGTATVQVALGVTQ
jgi:hypothetical protein